MSLSEPMNFRCTISHVPSAYIIRSPNEIRKITEVIDLVIQYKGHSKLVQFYVSSVGHKAIVLGHTWLVEHNPNINWHTGEVKMTHCPDYCRHTEVDGN